MIHNLFKITKNETAHKLHLDYHLIICIQGFKLKHQLKFQSSALRGIIIDIQTSCIGNWNILHGCELSCLLFLLRTEKAPLLCLFFRISWSLRNIKHVYTLEIKTILVQQPHKNLFKRLWNGNNKTGLGLIYLYLPVCMHTHIYAYICLQQIYLYIYKHHSLSHISTLY